MTDELEEMAIELEKSGQFRVLRRIVPGATICADDGGDRWIGIIVDVETTGLDTANDEIIELGMIKFQFSAQGRVYRILDTFASFRQPSTHIPAKITELTGITDAMVAGQIISSEEVARFISDADLVVAHNAYFDRRMVERYWPEFGGKRWACSATEVNWGAEGFVGTRLPYLVAEQGYFYDAHRAVDDCNAVLHALTQQLPKSNRSGLRALMDATNANSVRIWAEGAPFEKKDLLKSRGYRWSDGSGGTRRAWWIDVSEQDIAQELVYLQNDIYGRAVNLPTRKLSAFDRFSTRAD